MFDSVSRYLVSKRFLQRIATLLFLLFAHTGSTMTNAFAATLDGRWLGYLGCVDQGFEKTFFLEIDGATARMSGSKIRPQDLSIEVGSDQTFSANFSGWAPNFDRGPNTQIDLSGKFISGAEALYGHVEGWRTSCPNFVAVRAPQPESSENSSGILFKIEPRDARTASNLTPSECRAYAHWLASGEIMKLGRRPTQVNSAIFDLAAMRSILGRDIYNWGDDDRGRIRIIGNACRIQLQGSADAADRALVEKIRGIWVPATLTARPRIHVDVWHLARLLVHNELLLSLPQLRGRIEEGLYDNTADNASSSEAQSAVDQSGFVGKWHGYYVCNNSEFYLQLDIETQGSDLSAIFSFGSSLTASIPRGALSMTADKPENGRIFLKPHEWIQQPRGFMPFGLSGTLSAGGNRIDGRVEGAGETCQAFYASRRTEPERGKNADGLLFKITGTRNNELDEKDCRRYARWVATNQTMMVGRDRVSTLVLDQDAMFEVLGKDAASWGEDDHLKIRDIASQCNRLMRQSMNLDDLELVRSITDWSPYPFPLPKSEGVHWLVAAQVPLVIAEAREQAGMQVEKIEKLSFEPDSLRAVDVLLEDLEAGKGRLMFLPKEAKNDHRQRLVDARERLGVQVADTLSKEYSLFPQTLDGLDTLAEYHQTQVDILSGLNAVLGEERLNGLYSVAVRARALELWPELISEAHAALKKFDGMSFSQFPKIISHDKRVGRLERHYIPVGEEAIGEIYTVYLERRREVVEAMVEHSQETLIAWIDSLPPSKTAREKIELLSQAVFGTPAIPGRFADLHAAADAKFRAYNADHWQRPNIGLAILRGHWAEVDHRGLESLAYITTLLRSLKELCPGILPDGAGDPGAGALMSYAASASADAISRIKQGEVTSQQEAQRTVFLFLNMMVNRPGCRMNYYGHVIGCVSQEQFSANQEALMTSGEGLADGNLLAAQGCSASGPRQFVQNIVAYAEMNPHSRRVPPLELQDAWDYVARHE